MCRMPAGDLIEKELTQSIIGAFYEIYNTMGFGFVENIYANSLERELIRRGHRVGREISVQVMYKDDYVGTHRLDFLIDDRVEAKFYRQISTNHENFKNVVYQPLSAESVKSVP